MDKPKYKAQKQTGQVMTVSAATWQGMLEGAVCLMGAGDVDEIELFEWASPYGEGPQEYVSVGRLVVDTW